MAYFLDRRFNPVDMWQGFVKRNIDLLWRIAHEFFLPAEELTRCFDSDCLGIWVGVRSTERPEGLLRKIKKEAFPTFAFLGVTFDGRNLLDPFSCYLRLG